MPRLLSIDRSDLLIQVPASMVLTASGLRVFQEAKRPVSKVRKFNGSLSEGIVCAHSFHAQTVQKLIMNGYLEELNTALPEMLKYRREIIDSIRLAVFGLLYKKMNPSLAQMMLHSEVLLGYNRKNPQSAIRELAHVDVRKYRALKQSQADKLEFMGLEIRNRVVENLISDEKLQEEDRLLQIRSLEKFMAFIDDRIWYLYYILYHSPFQEKIRTTFSELIGEYLRRTSLASHLGNIAMELIQNAEKAHFDRLLLEKHLIRSVEDSHKFLRKVENRKRVVDLARAARQDLLLSLQFHSGKAAANMEYKLELLIQNKTSISHTTQQKLSGKMNTTTGEQSISDFFQESSAKLGAGLGLLYISYLKEECKRAGISFQSQIYGDNKNDATVAKLQLVL